MVIAIEVKQAELKSFVCQWLMNELLLGEKTIEIFKSEDFKGNPDVHWDSPLRTLLPRYDKGEKLAELKELVLGCNRCDLHRGRKNLVFGVGNPDSSLVFIGEAPGREEDAQGIPFVGEAGKLLTELLESVGISRKDVYITNVLKCRPPGNRDPLQDEISKCSDWLKMQLGILSPKIICTLGRYATYSLLGLINQASMFSGVRGKIYEYKILKVQGGSSFAKVIPTYHPAALLYHPKWKDQAISDLKLVKKLWNMENSDKD